MPLGNGTIQGAKYQYLLWKDWKLATSYHSWQILLSNLLVTFISVAVSTLCKSTVCKDRMAEEKG